MIKKLNSYWTSGVSIYFAGLYPFLLLYMIGVTFLTEEAFQTNWMSLVVILFVLIAPFTISSLIVKNDKWSNRVLIFMYWSSIILTGFVVFAWYVIPTNPRLEPLTILFGFATAIITFNRQNIPKLISQETL